MMPFWGPEMQTFENGFQSEIVKQYSYHLCANEKTQYCENGDIVHMSTQLQSHSLIYKTAA